MVILVLENFANNACHDAGNSANLENFHIEIKNNFNLMLPTAMISSLLSPKFLLPIILIYKLVKGGLDKVLAEVALPGFEIQMYKLFYQKSWYQPLSKSTTFMLAGQLGYENSYGGKVLPFYKNFFSGGVNSVRGFRQGAIGPVEIEPATGQNVFVGGNKQVIGNAELFFPLPFAKDSKQFRASIFLDAGSVYAKNDPISLGDLRYSAGAGIMWVSPFGPLKLLYAKALNAQSTDITESIQFQIGQQF